MKDRIVWKDLNSDKIKTVFSKSSEMMNMPGAQLTVGMMRCFEPQAQWLLNWFQEGVKLQSHGIDLTY